MSAPPVSPLERRYSILGHLGSRGSIFGPNISPSQVVAYVVGAGFVMLVALTTRNVFAVLGGILVAVVGVIMAGRVTREGESWLSTQTGRVTSWWLRRSGQSSWHPSMGLPPTVGRMRELAYVPDPANPEVVIGLMHSACPKGTMGPDSTISAVLEVVGGGEGLRSLIDANSDAERYGRFLSSLASRTSPVVQVDVETKIFPRHPDTTAAYFESLLAPDCSPELRASMEGLTDQVVALSEDYFSYVTVTFSLKELAYGADGPMTADQVADLAGEGLRTVVRRLTAAGIEVRDVLNPAKIGAVIRNLWVPVFPLHSTAEVTSAADGFAWPYEVKRDAVVVHGPELVDQDTGETTRDWWHAVATIPPRGFPPKAVDGRWLAGLITDVSPSPIRTVKVQHRLVSKSDMLRRTISRLTVDKADERSDEKKGRISSGSATAACSIRERMLQDLQHEDAAGTQALVHIVVSGRTEIELKQAQRQLEEAADNMGISALKWHKNKHHVGMILGAPMGRWHA